MHVANTYKISTELMKFVEKLCCRVENERVNLFNWLHSIGFYIHYYRSNERTNKLNAIWMILVDYRPS